MPWIAPAIGIGASLLGGGGGKGGGSGGNSPMYNASARVTSTVITSSKSCICLKGASILEIIR